MQTLFEIILLSLIIFVTALVAGKVGESRGLEKANKTMWETPPDMAYCIVYQDGGKKCIPKQELPKTSLVECIRQCRISTRMEKVK